MTRFHVFLAFIALAILRIAVGYHFFKEGQAKLESGTFTAEYFLSGANGPLVPKFRAMLDDPDGETILCVDKWVDDGGQQRYQLDPADTYMVWEKFVDRASGYYGLGSKDLEQLIAKRREQTGETIRKARDEKDESVDTRQLELKRAADAEAIKLIRDQPKLAKKILEDHKTMLASWLDFYKTDVVSFFGTADRLDGFERDGENRDQVGTYVQSLRYQIDEIESDRKKQLSGWRKDVAAIWDSLERQVNDLAVADQAERAPLPLERSYAPSDSMLSTINRVIPWFDVIVGSLLILGLFTRFASLAAAGFLLSVLATQPFWIPGSNPTYLYMVEFAALLVIFSACAGRSFGLDFFIHSFFRRKPTNTHADAAV